MSDWTATRLATAAAVGAQAYIVGEALRSSGQPPPDEPPPPAEDGGDGGVESSQRDSEKQAGAGAGLAATATPADVGDDDHDAVEEEGEEGEEEEGDPEDSSGEEGSDSGLSDPSDSSDDDLGNQPEGFAKQFILERQDCDGVPVAEAVTWAVGMRLEAVDRLNPRLIAVASVAEIREHEPEPLRIHFDGWTDRYDYWADVRSADLHPAGYCARNGLTLQPPQGHIGNFNIVEYADAIGAELAPLRNFNDVVAEGDGALCGTIDQFVDHVSNFSSQYGRRAYCASKLVGPPAVYPRYGDYTNAFVVRTYGPWWRTCPSAPPPIAGGRFGSRDFVELDFKTPVVPEAIRIYETYNIGAIVRILARPLDQPGRWEVLWSGRPTDEAPEARIFSPPLAEVGFFTTTLRLELDSANLDYYAEIDAVMLCGRSGNFIAPVVAAAADVVATAEANSMLFDEVERSMSGAGAAARVPSEGSRVGSGDGDAPADPDAIGGYLESGMFEILPDEIVSSILEQLALTDVLRLACVSRRFFYLSRSVFHRMPELDLQPQYQVVSDRFLEYMGLKLHAIRRVSLSWTGSIGGAAGALPWSDGASPNRAAISRELGLPVAGAGTGQGTEMGDRGGMGPVGHNAMVVDMVSPAGACRFVVSCGSSLRTLRLACCSFVTNEVMEVIVATCVNLEDLDVQRCDQLTPPGFGHIAGLGGLRRLNLYNTSCNDGNMIDIVRACGGRLEHINLGHCEIRTESEPEVVRAIAASCPNLVSLDLWFWRRTTTAAIVALCVSCRQLKELDLGWSAKTCMDFWSVMQDPALADLGLPRGLEKLVLTANKCATDSMLQQLCAQCPGLQQLDLLNSSDLTPAGVVYLLENCQTLAFLDISFCGRISAADAADWNMRYAHVDVKRSFSG